jgi:hypothetical protein
VSRFHGEMFCRIVWGEQVISERQIEEDQLLRDDRTSADSREYLLISPQRDEETSTLRQIQWHSSRENLHKPYTIMMRL